MNKPNKIHKKFPNVTAKTGLNNHYDIFKDKTCIGVCVDVLIENSDEWKDEKSEIDVLLSKLNGIVGVSITLNDPFKTTAQNYILEFAKNYKP